MVGLLCIMPQEQDVVFYEYFSMGGFLYRGRRMATWPFFFFRNSSLYHYIVDATKKDMVQKTTKTNYKLSK